MEKLRSEECVIDWLITGSSIDLFTTGWLGRDRPSDTLGGGGEV